MVVVVWNLLRSSSIHSNAGGRDSIRGVVDAWRREKSVDGFVDLWHREESVDGVVVL